MIIACNTCNTTYNIDASKIPAAGVTANCKKCGNKFRVHPGPASQPAPQAPVPASAPLEARENQMGLKPLSGLTQSLRVLLMISIAVYAVAVLGGIFEYRAYMALPADVDLSETVIPAEIVTALIGLVQLILFIIIGITFLRWIYRANTNLGALSGQPMRFSPGWSVGWYFIPIACLFKPYQVMKEIWQKSHKYGYSTDALLGLWWALWLISTFLGELAMKSILEAKSVTDLSSSTITYMVSDGIDAVLSIVALMLVTRIANAYTKNYSRQSGPAGGLAMPQDPGQPDRPISPNVQAF
jgi:predicted Zn finger-like uncharacterized protein